MLYLQKILIVLTSLVSTALYAGAMGPICDAGNVTIPCEDSGWDFGVSALYLHPNFNGLNYDSSYTLSGFTTANRKNTVWGWGFKLEGGYRFNSGNDLSLKWYHWNRSHQDLRYMNSFSLASSLPVVLNVQDDFAPKWDAVNAEFGQEFDVSNLNVLHLHGGIQYAQLNTGHNRNIFSASEKLYLRYKGVGPRLGLNAAYLWKASGLGFYVNGASALLVGHTDFNLFRSGMGEFGVPGDAAGSNSAVVSEFDGKLGANYILALAQSNFIVDLGWMWVNYVDALSFINPLTAGVAIQTQSNFALNGPYFGLKWNCNI